MRRMACLLGMLTCAACGDAGEAPAAIAEVIDSAGVRIVTSEPGDAVFAEVAEEPTLSLGALDGPEELLFGQIASVARDDEGNLVVADNGAGEIRVFGTGGGHLRSFGGRGEGPGEFQSLVGAWPSTGGGVVAVDRQLQRITRFDPTGALTGTATLSGVGELSIFTPIGLAGSGAFLSRFTPFSMPTMGESSETSLEEAFGGLGPPDYVVRHRFDGSLIDTVTQRPGVLMSASTSGSGSGMAIQLLRVPFSPEPSATGSDHGVAVTGGGDYEVGFFDEAGALSRIARLAEAPTIRTEEHLDAYVRNSGNPFAQDEASIRGMIAMYEGLPLPESLPAYTDLRFADTGELWARRYSQRGATMLRWDVFGADGSYLGRVAIPASFRIEEISRGQLVGVSRDELDVQRVEVRDLGFVGR